MNKFKVGDTVTPVDVSCRLYSEEMKQLVFTPLTVVDPTPDRDDTPFVLTKDSKGVDRFWFASDLRLVVDDSEPTAPLPEKEKPKVLHRGDLVKYGDAVCVIVDGNLTNNTHHLVAMLDGFWVGCEYAPVEHLTKIGSVRKKVKKLKAQMGGMK